MKRSFLLIIILFIIAFVSCNDLDSIVAHDGMVAHEGDAYLDEIRGEITKWGVDGNFEIKFSMIL